MRDSSGKIAGVVFVFMNSSYETEPYKDKKTVNFAIFSVGRNKFIEYLYTLKFNSLCKLLNFLSPVALSDP